MGGKRKPAALHELQGTQNRRKTEAVVIVPAKVRAPKSLTGDAREEWDRLYPYLAANKIMTPADISALSAHCLLYARWLAAENQLTKHIKKGGSFIHKTKRGVDAQHPLIMMVRQLASEFRKSCCEFGLTPSSRSNALRKLEKQNRAPKHRRDNGKGHYVPTPAETGDPTADMNDGVSHH